MCAIDAESYSVGHRKFLLQINYLNEQRVYSLDLSNTIKPGSRPSIMTMVCQITLEPSKT